MNAEKKPAGPEAAHDLERLPAKRLAALRFASDGELALLLQAALADPTLSPDALKQRVRVWQADHLRV